MKAVVIQEPIAQPDLTPQELTARWQALAALPGVDEVTILTPPAYPSAAEIGALAADADALFGVWIGPYKRRFPCTPPQAALHRNAWPWVGTL